MEVESSLDAANILDWLRNRGGVTVWASLDLGSAGRMMYTPGDKPEKPHWSMGLVEVITDPSRIDLYVIETVSTKPPKRDGFIYDRRRRDWWRAVPYKESENDPVPTSLLAPEHATAARTQE